MTPSSAGSSADDSSVDGGDTESVHEDENSASDHELPPSTQANSKVASVEEEAWQSNLALNQAIVKGVFGKLLKRDDITHVLKKKFAVQQKMITNLKPTELLNVLARKLVRHNYCKLKGEGKNKEDIIVLKEISFFWTAEALKNTVQVVLILTLIILFLFEPVKFITFDESDF